MGIRSAHKALFTAALVLPLSALAAPGLGVATTVGTVAAYCTDPGNPDNCGLPPTNMVSVEPGEPYVVGYNATNTGDTEFISHTLTDTVFGLLLNNFPYTLPPASSAFITHRGNAPLISGSYPQSAIWTGTTAGGDIVSASGSVSLTVLPPDFEITTTVAPAIEVCTNPDDIGTCSLPTRHAIDFVPGRKVVISYLVHNSAAFAMPTHTLVDSALGSVLNNFAYNLSAGASAFLTVFDTPASDTVRSATWTVTTTYGATAARSDQYAITRFLFADGFE
ncbi:MAG: hypothetical protein HYV17_07105 [Xanthomonadales bacterium]|nr:hypothetical protein [Xanthomonadales bacterium]